MQNLMSWLFAMVLVALGIMNLILVHPVPGIVYLVLSLIYFPPVVDRLERSLGFGYPLLVKILLGIVIIWVTLGITDLAELYGL